jgi:hypothetical protein
MKNLILFTLLLIFFLPTSLKAQWERETGITIGNLIPNYPKGFYDDSIFKPSVKFSISQSWYKPDRPISVRPEVGLNLEYMAVSIGFGGLAGGNSYNGKIYSINGELALMTQIQLGGNITFSVGPAGKYLISDYANLKTKWWMQGTSGGESETKGFNRDYLYKPSLGFKAMLFDQKIKEKYCFGFSFERLWKGSTEDLINYTGTTEISLYFGFH